MVITLIAESNKQKEKITFLQSLPATKICNIAFAQNGEAKSRLNHHVGLSAFPRIGADIGPRFNESFMNDIEL